MSASYPNIFDRFNDWAFNVSTRDGNNVIYKSGNVRIYNYHLFASEGSNGHLHVEVSIDGHLWHEVAVRLVDDVTDNSITRSIPVGQIAVLKGKYPFIRVLSFGDVSAVGFHGWN